jgi:hypothetical protein|tara:strand:+ start:1095 stop:1862 length:768 start_codon:yes stop_codon:yes gene_type:complete
MEEIMSNNYIKDTLKDVIRHTHDLGIFEMVKIRGTTTQTEIETVDADKTVIVKGTTNDPVADFADATIGLSRMGVLKSFLQYPGYDSDGATVQVNSQDRNGEQVPTEVQFVSEEGGDAHYRFMLADVINQQLKDIKFKGAEFDVTIKPGIEPMKNLAYFTSALAAYEPNFMPKTEGGALYFYIGGQGSDRTKILIDNNVEGEITTEWNWPLDIVLKILRLGNSAMVDMSFNNQGLLQITVDSGMSKFTYLLPARS